MNEDSEILLDVAVLGEQVDQFMQSDVGQYLLQLAAIQEEKGLEELKRVKCNDPEAVREAQNKVWLAESFRTWLKNAVASGLKARQILEDRQE